MEKETKTMEIMEEAGNNILLEDSDSDGRARLTYQCHLGKDCPMSEDCSEECIDVFRSNLHIRVERTYDPLRGDPYEETLPGYRIVETDLVTGRKLTFIVTELIDTVDAE